MTDPPLYIHYNLVGAARPDPPPPSELELLQEVAKRARNLLKSCHYGHHDSLDQWLGSGVRDQFESLDLALRLLK